MTKYKVTCKYSLGAFVGEETFVSDSDNTTDVYRRLWEILEPKGIGSKTAATMILKRAVEITVTPI